MPCKLDCFTIVRNDKCDDILMKQPIFKKAKTYFFAVLSFGVAWSFAFLVYQTASAQWSAPTCTPPNCNPEGGSGGGVGTLLELLKSNALAQLFGAETDNSGNPHIANDGNGDYNVKAGTVSIGGALNADGTTKSGRVMFGLGTSTPGFSFDVISQKRENGQTPTDKDTAIMRLGYSSDAADAAGNPDKVWTGLRLDRNANKNQEKWFVGMDSTSDNFIIKTKDGSGNDRQILNVSQDQATKGAACTGAMFRQFSGNWHSGNAGGYAGANAKCPLGTHVCTIEEMYRTTLCSASSISSATNDDQAAWINGGISVDCEGWTNENVALSGTYWTFDGTMGRALTLNCDYPLKFACCQ